MENLPVKQNNAPFSVAPTNLAEAMQFAEMVAKSCLVPKAFQNRPGDVLVAMQMGAELGVQPMQALQNIAVINGRPSVWGDLQLALCKGHHSCQYVIESLSEDGKVATCRAKRKGETEVIQTFSEEDARQAGLWKKAGPWSQYPKRMLQMRARGFALRDTFPDVLRGIAQAEESMDIEVAEATEVKQAEKPKTGNDKVKQLLAGSDSFKNCQTEEEPAKKTKKVISYEYIEEKIGQAETLEELSEAGKEANSLADCDKEKARRAFTEKKGDLVAESKENGKTHIVKMIEKLAKEIEDANPTYGSVWFKEQISNQQYGSLLEMVDDNNAMNSLFEILRKKKKSLTGSQKSDQIEI